MKPRLVVLVSHPIQYYAPLYREMAGRGSIDLHVIYLSDAGASAYHDGGFGREIAWDIPLLDGYSYTVLQPGTTLDDRGFWSLTAVTMRETLDALDPDAVLLYGYASRMNWQALRWANQRGLPVLYTSDSNANMPTARWKSRLKRLVVGHFFSKIDTFLCTSEANWNYLARFGAQAERMVRVPFAIDVQRFSASAPLPAVRRRFDFAWAGKLLRSKRPDDFLRALRIVAETSGRDVSATLIGDGPMRKEMETLVQSLPPTCHLELKGFVNQAAMPSALQSAEIFVFTSMLEAYGLAATEAAAAGQALIVADGMGCVGDTVLAQPGVNATLYPAGDVPALAKAMLEMLIDDSRRQRMQAASLDIAREHDFPVAADIIEAAVRNACDRDRSRATA